MIVTVVKPLTDNTGIVPPWLMPDYREPIPTVPYPDDPIITDEEEKS